MDQLLTTKLYIPQIHEDLVPRPRLYQRLDAGVTRKLVLVSAPTGFGKSTLVTSWLADRSQSAAWLSLDQGDNDPVRFWSYLVAAIQTIHPQIGVEAHQIIAASQLRSTEIVAISLLNDISQLTAGLVLILDDYHIIEASQVHESLSYILEHQPPNLHIILITRVDPSISLARLRVHRQLIEIRAEDLQFSSQEAASLLNEKMGLNLNPGQIEALNTHTESWVVGLQLAALSLKGQSSYDRFIDQFTGGHQYILDYLTEEVLDTLPENQREFLLQTSILERFSAALCQEISGDPSSGQTLDEIRKQNLFLIPLDIEGRWFRYQHLFAEVLYTLLMRDHPEEISALHLKAAAWFDQQGFADEAVEHTLKSGDMIRARQMVLKHWMAVFHRGEVATVLQWLDALPEQVTQDDPIVLLAKCWALFLSWQNTAIEPVLEQAKLAYQRLLGKKSLDGEQQDQIAAQLAMMRSVLARERGQHDESVAYAEEAARLIPQEMMEGIGTAWNMLAAARAGAGDFEGAIQAYQRGNSLVYDEGNLVAAYGCIYGQAMYLLIQGRLTEAERLCRSAIERAEREGHGEYPAAGSLYITMARIALERFQLDDAQVNLNNGLRIARPGGFIEAERTGRYIRAQLAALQGDLDAAEKILEDLERIVAAMDEPYVVAELSWQWAAHYIKTGDLQAAREKLQILDDKIAITRHANLLLWRGWLFPRLLVAEGRYQEARAALDESIRRARAADSKGEIVHLLALQAMVLDALGERQPAHAALLEGLALGAPENYIWRLLDAGPGLGGLLQSQRTDGETSQDFIPYLDSLQEACRTVYGGAVQSLPQDLPELLTARELEILRLICQGYSNPQIASQLVVSLNTVKKHTSNIYGKLGVSSRTQAIARSYELNLL